MILPREKYQKTVKRPYPPLLGSLVLSGTTNEAVYEGFFSVPFARKDSLLCDGVWYNNEEVENYGRHLIGTEWINKSSIDSSFKKMRDREKTLLESVNKPFFDFSQAFENYMVALTLVYLAEQPIYDKLKKALLFHTSPEETKRLLGILNVPLEDNIHKKEEFDLVMTSDLKKHVDDYEWFLSRYGSEIKYTLEEVNKRLSVIDKKLFLREYGDQKREIEQAIGTAKKIISAEFEYLVDAMQFIVFYRTHRTDVISKVMFLHIPVLRNIAEFAGITYEDILYCLEDEILTKNIPAKTIIDDRKKGFAIASVDNKIVCYVGEEFEKLRDSLIDEVDSVDEITGNSASEGVVEGRVKVINDKSDFSKMTEGDVLVSSMTTPEMIPIMKIARAFVTDEGGITCHAAIVAREMGKPCVIGTKLATKVFKDGDLVRVDASKGTVSRLS